MTESVLKSIKVTLPDGEEIRFSGDAIKEIMQANSGIDGDRKKGGTFWQPYRHCDDELINECTDFIKNSLIDIINILKKDPVDAKNARILLGKTLHTLQDFYSHSNWVNIKGSISAQLGNVVINNPPVAQRASIFNITPDNWSDTQTCRWLVNGVIGDLYLESYPDADLDKSIVGIYPTNTLAGIGKNIITSGYFLNLGATDPYGFKCAHGIGSFVKTRGINKDEEGQPLFTKALSSATQNTKELIDSIINSDGIKNNKKIVRNFLGLNKSVQLGFVIDTSWSMRSTLTGVKSAMKKVVTNIKNNPDKFKDLDLKFLVLPYAEGIGDVSIANTPDEMLSHIDNIEIGIPDGGDDCPESSMDALKKAIESAEEDSVLYLYTDADTKRAGLGYFIASQAKKKNIKINIFVSGFCPDNNDIDPTYRRIGVVQKYPNTESGAENTFASINPIFSGDLHDGFLIIGTIPGTRLKSQVQKNTTLGINVVPFISEGNNSETYHFMPNSNGQIVSKALVDEIDGGVYPILIDASVSNFVTTVDMAPLGTVKIYRPDGSEVLESDDDAIIVKSSLGQSINIDKPTIGEWSISIAGISGTQYEINTKMNTNIRFVNFSFAEEKGRPGHTGLFPINGQPLVTEEQYILATLSGSINSSDLILVSLEGDKLGTFELIELSSGHDFKKYIGRIMLPNEKFRVHARGIDKDGNTFERSLPKIYKGQSVSIALAEEQNSILPNNEFIARFFVKNTGVKDTFSLSASDTSGYIQSIDPIEVTLDTRESQEVKVIMEIDSTAIIGSTATVTLLAESIANINSRNTITSDFIVKGDSDNDGIPDDFENDNKLNPNDSSDALSDQDGDDLNNLEEYQNNTNPNIYDTDDDGFSDGEEIDADTDPLNPNSHPTTPLVIPPATLTISPTTPTSNDTVTVTASGEWNTSCAPTSMSIESSSGNITRLKFLPDFSSSDICLQVITPWSLSTTVGTLPQGTHTLEVFRVIDNSQQVLGTSSVSVQVPPVVITPPPTTNPTAQSFTSTAIVMHSNKCLDIDANSTKDGANAHQFGCHGNDNQSFVFTPVDGKTDVYTIKAKHSNKCLDVKGASTKDGSSVLQWSCGNNKLNQQFTLESVGTKIFQIKPLHSGQCLDVFGNKETDKADVIQWPCGVDKPNQQWLLNGYQ